MRPLFSTLTLFILAGCDTLHGIHIPVEPAFEGQTWACASEMMESEGYSMKTDEIGQLSVSSNESYLFSAYPDRDGKMKLYSYALHQPPACTRAEEAYGAMKSLIRVLEEDCEYTAKSYSVSFECSSNNQVN